MMGSTAWHRLSSVLSLSLRLLNRFRSFISRPMLSCPPRDIPGPQRLIAVGPRWTASGWWPFRLFVEGVRVIGIAREGSP
jgi:hypothetical protein